MNRDFTYPSTGRTSNQLATLDHVMAFTSPLPGSPDTLPELLDPADGTADLDDRARAYLHTNCAQCHQPNGGTPLDLDFRYDTLLNMTQACDISPTAGDLGIGANARIIAPGSAANSVLLQRMDRRDGDAMPPVGSSIVDSAGVTLIASWINNLPGCN